MKHSQTTAHQNFNQCRRGTLQSPKVITGKYLLEYKHQGQRNKEEEAESGPALLNPWSPWFPGSINLLSCFDPAVERRPEFEFRGNLISEEQVTFKFQTKRGAKVAVALGGERRKGW